MNPVIEQARSDVPREAPAAPEIAVNTERHKLRVEMAKRGLTSGRQKRRLRKYLRGKAK